MDEMKRHIKSTYEDRGVLPRGMWKEGSDKLFGAEEVHALYSEMVAQGIVPKPDGDFTFVSPTANVPTHETAFFEADQKVRQGQSRFLVGDISENPLEETQIQQSTETGAFQYFRWDAEHLPIRSASVDMIWDRKGWLWHTANANKPELFIKALTDYELLLKQGGCIVIDDIGTFEETMRRMPIHRQILGVFLFLLQAANIRPTRYEEVFAGSGALEYEDSTTRVIGTMDEKNNTRVLRQFSDRFDFLSVGTGAGRMLVMRKK